MAIHACPECGEKINNSIGSWTQCSECGHGFTATEETEHPFGIGLPKKKEMTVLEKLHKIEDAKCIYDIHYCRAGVGFIFYYPNEDKINWRDNLSVKTYYPTFEEAVEAEYNGLEEGMK